MRRFANIDSDYATALMASEDPRNLGWNMAKGTLGNIIKLDEAQNDADTTEYIGDRYASQTIGNALWGLGSSLLSPIAKQAGTNIGAGRNILDSGQGGFFGPSNNIYGASNYDSPMFEDPAMTGGQDVFSTWDSDTGKTTYDSWNTDYSVNPKYDPSSDQYYSLGNRWDRFTSGFRRGW